MPILPVFMATEIFNKNFISLVVFAEANKWTQMTTLPPPTSLAEVTNAKLIPKRSGAFHPHSGNRLNNQTFNGINLPHTFFVFR